MSGLVFVIDKEKGPTSFDVVRDVRHMVHGEKTGHAGSLDPFATGVLVVMVGKATKLSGALLNADKTYRALAKLGEATDSMDSTGTVRNTLPVPDLSEDEIREVLKGFEGEWMQMPPMYSAKKQQGVRLYELARKNVEVERQPIPVQLYKVEFVRWEKPLLEFDVHCSKGTYVRALADELGKRLGTVAHLTELRRLSCGPFKLEESLSVPTLRESFRESLEPAYRNYVRLLMQEGYGRQLPPSGRQAKVSSSGMSLQQ